MLWMKKYSVVNEQKLYFAYRAILSRAYILMLREKQIIKYDLSLASMMLVLAFHSLSSEYL